VSVLVLHDLTGKPSVKADFLIYSNFVTVSAQCLSVAIYVHTWMVFLQI